jgi:hypothetical protein
MRLMQINVQKHLNDIFDDKFRNTRACSLGPALGSLPERGAKNKNCSGRYRAKFIHSGCENRPNPGRLLRPASVGLGGFVGRLSRPDRDYPVSLCGGGATDILARMLGQGLSERLGKTFIVENRPGAGTMLAADAAAKSSPDDYALLMGTSTPLAINATLHKKLPLTRPGTLCRWHSLQTCRLFWSSIHRSRCGQQQNW